MGKNKNGRRSKGKDKKKILLKNMEKILQKVCE